MVIVEHDRQTSSDLILYYGDPPVNAIVVGSRDPTVALIERLYCTH